MTPTIIYFPVGLGQAQWCFENRSEAFARGFNTAESGLAGYKNRDDAIAAGAQTHVQSYGLLRLSIAHDVHERLAYQGHLKGTATDSFSGAELWTVTSDGCALLAHSCKCEMTMEIVPVRKDCARPGGCCGSC